MKKVSLAVVLVLLTTPFAFAAPKNKKAKRDQTKQVCLAENPNLKGRELQKCIKQKRRG